MKEQEMEICVKKRVQIDNENFYVTVGKTFATCTVPRENDPMMTQTRRIAETICDTITELLEMQSSKADRADESNVMYIRG